MSINNLFNNYASEYFKPQRILIITLPNKDKALNKQHFYYVYNSGTILRIERNLAPYKNRDHPRV